MLSFMTTLIGSLRGASRSLQTYGLQCAESTKSLRSLSFGRPCVWRMLIGKDSSGVRRLLTLSLLGFRDSSTMSSPVVLSFSGSKLTSTLSSNHVGLESQYLQLNFFVSIWNNVQRFHSQVLLIPSRT